MTLTQMASHAAFNTVLLIDVGETLFPAIAEIINSRVKGFKVC
jgi:hypothetical protein